MMIKETAQPKLAEEPTLMIALGVYAILGCLIFAASILIADQIVPDHDWIADTISDLGAGEYEFIVDIGIYAFAAALISLSLLAAHVHMGGWEWSLGTVGLALLGLIVFLVGARDEYGDSDQEGVVIHIYLVYALGALIAAIPVLMAKGVRRAGNILATALTCIAGVWTLSAPVFFLSANTCRRRI
ncbi:hypothetical protein PhaeoP97_03673 (plasmid) [Phaeobacter porticola]|uniref:DUF998 domain-containing protein n=1 Tax=Phaeobacter porticola TaxID=1844006 RepID=A0A1L3IAB8_9RHOB|nr:hypothetical protein PhaeoP97_03673 [Phaeobacter porticola]